MKKTENVYLIYCGQYGYIEEVGEPTIEKAFLDGEKAKRYLEQAKAFDELEKLDPYLKGLPEQYHFMKVIEAVI